MLYFDKVESKTKKGKVVKRLKAVPVDANIPFVIDFIEKMLPKIIHHRNLLKNYRTNLGTLIESIENVKEIWFFYSK